MCVHALDLDSQGSCQSISLPLCSAKDAGKPYCLQAPGDLRDLGYPKIFHTDNGKEFTAKVVLEFLLDLNPNIITVTGRHDAHLIRALLRT